MNKNSQANSSRNFNAHEFPTARGPGRFAYKVPALLWLTKFSLENSGSTASRASKRLYCIASAYATAMTA